MKLHLGSGKRYIPGFVHVDLADLPHIDYKHDIRDLSMFGDNTADLIYASHVFEYFDRIEAKDVLREWRRVLKPDGILRLAVPDFKKLVEVYSKAGRLALIHGPLYGRIELQTSAGLVTRYHRTCYDFDDLRSVLAEAGFGSIRVWDWRKTEHGNVDDYSQAYIPHMDKEKGTLISLNVEATKVVNVDQP